MATKFLKFTQTKLRGECNLVQLASVEFYDAKESQLKVKKVTNPDGCNPDENIPENVINGDTSSKWCDMNKGSLEFELNKRYNVATYKWATANDCAERDPVRWKLEGSSDGKKWTVLDDRSSDDYATPDKRGAYTGMLATNWKRDQDKKSKKKAPSKSSRSGKRKGTGSKRGASKRKR